jgi:hypothetical protein
VRGDEIHPAFIYDIECDGLLTQAYSQPRSSGCREQCAYSRHLPFAFSSPCCAVFFSRSILGSFEGTTTTNRDPEQRFLSLAVTGNNGELELEGMAGYSSGRTAAPDFSGKCYKKMKQYHFTFEDSFDNKGFGTITKVNDDMLFSATITTLKDSRCVPLYHSILLKRKKG